MAINKNFVVKNGLEVKSNLIVADSDINKVGIGTTSAEYKLHVIGGIGATDLVVSSALTATTANIDNLTVSAIGATTLTVSGLSTFTGLVDANGGIDVTGHTELDNLRVTGVSTFVGVATFQGSLYVGGDLFVADDVFYDEVSGRNLNISGIGTITDLVTTTGNIGDLTSASIGSTNINVSGFSTLGVLEATTLQTTGITTLASSGGITTTGGDLYVGNDLYFIGDLYQNGEIFASGVGIQTGDTLVGSGVTFIEFRGPGVSTGYYDATLGIATVFFEGGGGGGGGGAIGIGSTFPGTPLFVGEAPSNGDLFFHIDYGRTFIYYDEVTLGVGSSAFWVDSSPFNIGIITAIYGGVSFSDGSPSLPSWYFENDQTTGVFSPVNGELTFVSTGSSVLNINSSGINVTGIVTSTSINSGIVTAITVNSTTVNSGIVSATTVNSGIVSATSVYANGQELLRGVGIATEGGYVGSGATVIDFRGAGISTVTVSSGIATINVTGGGGGGAAAGGSGEFNTGITSTTQLVPLAYETTVFSFPSTAGKRYIIESINVSNTSASEVNLIAALNYNDNGDKVHLAYNVPLLNGSSVELLRQPHIANPSDYITMWTNNTSYIGVSSVTEIYMTYTESDDTDYFGVGFSTVSMPTTSLSGIFTSTTYPSVIQSIHLSNRTDDGDYPVSVEITNGLSTSYLVKDFIIPRYATVEICDRPKRIEVDGIVKVSLAATDSIDISISGKKITG